MPEDPEQYRRRMKSLHDNMEHRAREQGRTARPNQSVNDRLHEIANKRRDADHEYQKRKNAASQSSGGGAESSCVLVLVAVAVPILATVGLIQFV